ncbi:SAM-dependent MidA family methyltransferase [Anoxybacillus vitaminiphilus]|uniref:SAM-dependent MidA family methyltransferase n=1 Tax=Paranoxybacillus vitaminiphilus TaxID=581036 RepID=A0A327YQ67_9BACL|nr:SAM-dependent methyltransferase [Anoxybacillus vitaminiphilus]RAK22377.1 SAM-dependent MidA family methyltransferase [Anoxybacillus vitaminiphilus]
MKNFIHEAIERSEEGKISYSDYMQLALYDSQFGYYMREKEKIGRFGDFITSSNISDVFGKLFAKIFIQLVETEGIPPLICEIGGGNGRFARAVLQEWQKRSPDTYDRLIYMMIETSPYHRIKQKETLHHLSERIVSYECIEQFCEDFPRFGGIVFSNELFDAFPVHVIQKKGNSLYEIFITSSDGQLVETMVPLENEEIIAYLEERNISLVNGQRFEIPLMMKQFILEMGAFFHKGVVFTVDYGYTDEEWRLPARREGSLRGYYQHQLITNPLVFPGEMDLTTHIQWDALRMYGEKAGWQFVKLLRQDEFLLEAGILEYLTEHYDPNPFSDQSRQNRAIRTLLMDGGISTAFQIMIQQKNVSLQWDNIFKDAPFVRR